MSDLITTSSNWPRPSAEILSDEAIDLARRYATNGPRYTSYPTAPQFSSDFEKQPYLDWQAQKTRAAEPLSIYVHVPFCNDICYYCACNKVVTRREGVAARYLEHLTREIGLQSEIVGKDRPVTQMHWGGGTPTYLDDGEIMALMHSLASHFNLIDREYREYSIEIDPRTVSDRTIALLKGVGFNRVSLGIQDFDERVQRAVNRFQPFQEVADLVKTVRSHDYKSLSFDLIYGLPYQNPKSMSETLQKVLSLRPDRIACYNYAHLPERFLPQRAIDRHTLPEPEEKLEMMAVISETLTEAGYRFIGMDHYVLPGDELAVAQGEGRLQRNFQGYSLRLAEDLLGLGVSAISQLGDFYLQNARDLPSYYGALDSGQLPLDRGYESNDDDRLRRHIIMSLICGLHLDIEECEAEFGIDFDIYFADALESLQGARDDQLLLRDARGLHVTERGRPFLRNLCMPFDACLSANKEQVKFSATV